MTRMRGREREGEGGGKDPKHVGIKQHFLFAHRIKGTLNGEDDLENNAHVVLLVANHSHDAAKQRVQQVINLPITHRTPHTTSLEWKEEGGHDEEAKGSKERVRNERKRVHTAARVR